MTMDNNKLGTYMSLELIKNNKVKQRIICSSIEGKGDGNLRVITDRKLVLMLNINDYDSMVIMEANSEDGESNKVTKLD